MFAALRNLKFCAVICCWVIPLFLRAADGIEIAPIHEAYVSKFTDPTPLFTVAETPPQVRAENVPPKPYEDAIWIPGYFAWVQEKNDFAWICGVWRRPPIGHVWIPGSWEKTDSGWIWAKGFWSSVPQDQLKFITKVPPSVISDKIAAAPGPDYFWTPGYWNYEQIGSSYRWLSGKWEKSNPNWVLAPACYIWRPSGFVFAPFYWDWPLEKRGKAYNCFENDSKLVAMEPEMVMQRLFIYYPDYCLFYWHWWHFHPNWVWDGCGCVPPWWGWHDWWFLGWSDCWGLWWWWGHPGAFPPFWLTLELSLEIAPPPFAIIDFFKQLNKPHFDIKLGDKLIPPQGKPGKQDVPFPNIPHDVTPGGQITPPALPDTGVTLPPPPPMPDQEPTPPAPSYPPQQPTPPSYYPEEPPTYYPPQDRIPDRRPPGRRPPQWPPERPDRGDRPNYPPRPNYVPPDSKTPPPNYVPPQRTPPRPPSPNYIPPQQTAPRIPSPNYIPPQSEGLKKPSQTYPKD